MHKNLITDPNTTSTIPHKYLGILGMVWISVLLVVTLTSLKTFEIFGVVLSAAVIAYPLTYIFSDIFTEVYGYRVSRRIVWTGFVCVFLATLFAYALTFMPAPVSFTDNEAFNTVFRASPILSFLVVLGFWAGEMANSFTVAKVKIWTKGANESLRYVSSTFIGLSVDSLVWWWGMHFLMGWFTSTEIWTTIFVGLVFCVSWEILALPITKRVIRWIKEKEGIDTYDHGTNFNPFKF
jgi:uncharacterized integral membrane protein (TIGR00697 family)